MTGSPAASATAAKWAASSSGVPRYSTGGRHITPCAPAAPVCSAYLAEAAVDADEMPTVTGRRPSATSSAVSITTRRSSSDRLPASPIVPLTTRPWTPPSITWPMFARNASKSIESSSANGTTTAGMMPGKVLMFGS